MEMCITVQCSTIFHQKLYSTFLFYFVCTTKHTRLASSLILLLSLVVVEEVAEERQTL